MAYIGMFINLAKGDTEIPERIKAFQDGVATAYKGAQYLEPVYGGGVYHTYQDLALALVQSSPAPNDTLYFAPCGPSLWALQIAAGKDRPIVCAGVVDPYNTGVMIDGYKVSGYYSYDIDQASKLLFWLWTFYGVTRAAVIWDPHMRAGAGQITALLPLASQKHITLTRISVEDSEDNIRQAIKAFSMLDGVKGVVVLTSTRTATLRTTIIDAVNQYDLKAIYPNCLYYRSGGKLAYGPDTLKLYRIAGARAGAFLGGKFSSLQANPDPFEFCPDPKTLGLKISDAQRASAP